MSTNTKYPKRWVDDLDFPHISLENFLEDWENEEKRFASLGVPSHQVAEDNAGNIQLFSLCHLQPGLGKGRATPPTTTMTRRVPDAGTDEPLAGRSTSRRFVDGVTENWEIVEVATNEVTDLEGKGWAV